MSNEIYDIAILGAGPIGLEAALRAAEEGYKTVVIERGNIAENMVGWGHVQLFSPFSMNSSERGRHAVAKRFDETAFLTGCEHVNEYLEPLANYVSHSVRFVTQSKVERIERLGWPKGRGLGDESRAKQPFLIFIVEGGRGWEYQVLQSRCVIDATGTKPIFPNENGSIHFVDPCDFAIINAPEFHKRVAVVGSGATAATSVVTLAQEGVSFDWFTRNTHDNAVTVVPDDPLPGRRDLFNHANEIGRGPLCRRQPGRTYYMHRTVAGVITLETVDSAGNAYPHETDAVYLNIGQQPDTSIFRELHVHLCYATEGPIKLAAKLLGESDGDCLTQSGSNASLLVNPESNFFILGAKSYGRNSNFLIRAGIEQVSAVFDELLPKTLWPLIGR